MIRPGVMMLALLLPLSGYAADKIRVLAVGDEASCELVSQQVCSTTSMNPAEECLAWHKKQAADAGADALLIRGSEDSRRNKPSLTGMKTVVTTKVSADYYRCAAAVSVAETVVKDSEGWSTVEKRLLVLESLKSKGLISDTEYQLKRQDILKDL
jgi:hypothetical protein